MRLSQLCIQLSIIITLYQFTRVLATETVDSSEDDEEEEMFEVKNVPVSQKAGEELYQYWTDQAFSALMAAVAEEKLKDLSKKDKKSHHLCVKTSRSVETHARCVSQLLQWHEEKLERNSEEKKERRNTTNDERVERNSEEKKGRRNTTNDERVEKNSEEKEERRNTANDERVESNERNATTIERSENKTTVPTNNQSKVISEILYPIVHKEKLILHRTTPKIGTHKITKTSYFYPLQKALSSSKFEEENEKRKKFGPLWKILNGNERVLVMRREKEKNGMRNTVVMRTKRDVKSKSSYTLADSTLNRGDSLGKILEKVTNVIRVVKNKSEKPMSWQDLISEIRDAGERLKRKKAIREEYSDRIKDIQDMGSALQLDISQPLEIVGALDKLGGLVQSADSEKRLNDDAGMLRRRVDDGESGENEREPTAKELAARAPIHFIREGVKLGMMLGGKDTKGFEKKNIKIFSPKFLEMAPDRTEDSVHLLSPKFFTLHNETKDPIERALSVQNLLESTQHDGHQQMMNFIMEASGVSDVLQKIAKMEKMEDFSQMAQLDPRMFGDPELMERVKKGLEIPHPAPEEDNLEGIENKNIGEMLEKLANGVNTTQEYKIQMIDFQERGRTILTRRQRMLLYGKGSPFENEETLRENEDTDRKMMDKHLESTIRDLSVEGRRLILKNKKLEMKTNITKSIINEDSTGAFSVCAELNSDGTCLREEKLNSNVDNSPVNPYNKTKEFGKEYLALNRRHVMHKRVKRWGVYGTPIAFTPIIRMPVLASQPFILSPIIFSPLILSPCVFGILVLSPWIFTPIIVSPRVLAPIILSPELMDPLILSPLVLDPIIVSPGCGVPLILTPFVMSPFIVSPQVMTPLILTPLLLSPIILTPHVLTPLILSPLLLSPIILSPSYVGALVLSPTALSPAYLSKGEVFTAVMSPSILS